MSDVERIPRFHGPEESWDGPPLVETGFQDVTVAVRLAPGVGWHHLREHINEHPKMLFVAHDDRRGLASTHLRPDTTERLLAWIDRRLADIESDLGDEETLQSLGLHGRVRLHERRDTLKFMRAQIEQDR